MNTVPLRILLLALAVIGTVAFVPANVPEDHLPPRGAGPARAALGAFPEDVKERLGVPARVSRQVYQLRCQEQWHYGAPHHLRVTFDCPRGQKPRVTKVQSLADR